MSVKIMGAVWDSDLPRDEKYVLLSYADHAAHDGSSVYPSVDRTSWKTGYSDRSIHKITAKLINKGILVCVGTRRHGVKEYRIEISKLPPRPAYHVGCEDSSHPEETPHDGAKNLRSCTEETSDKPSCNRHEEPSCTEAAEPPTSYQEWLEQVQSSSNRSATLRWMIQVLYPYYKEEDLPSYGHIGKIAKQVGGAGNLANWIWRCAEHQPKGNLMSYIDKASRGGTNGKGQRRSGTLAQKDPGEPRLGTPSEEETLAFHRAFARKHAKEGRAESQYYYALTDEERAELGIGV
jgi:hypothetical protein